MTTDDERESFWDRIREDPDDDTVRLVFADWLSERGEEAHARFIRVQVAGPGRHNVPFSVARPVLSAMCGTEVKQRDVGTRDGRARHLSVAGDQTYVTFRRGFVDEIATTMTIFLAACRTPDAVRVLFRHPVTRVKLTDRDPDTPCPGFVPWWERSSAPFSCISRFSRYRIPAELFERLRTGSLMHAQSAYPDRRYDSRAEALEDLSRACVALGATEFDKSRKERKKVRRGARTGSPR